MFAVLAATASAIGGCSRGATSLDYDTEAQKPALEVDAGMKSLCGNGKIDATDVCNGEDLKAGTCIKVAEACDGVLLQGETCIKMGFPGGQLGCDPVTCTFDVSMCLRSVTTGVGGSGSPTVN